MAAQLGAAGNYTLVDTVVIANRTHKIWKSVAANNQLNKDWFLDVCYYTSGAGNMWLCPIESYDTTTDLATRMPYMGTNDTNIETTTYSRYGTTGYALESTSWPTNASTPSQLGLITSTTTFGYWISITGNRVIGITSAAPTNTMYAGTFTPHAVHTAAASTSAFPLVVAQLTGGEASAGVSPATVTAGLTRIPKSPTVNWNATPDLVPSTAYMSPSMATTPAYVSSYAATTIDVHGHVNHSSNTSGLLGRLTDVLFVTAPSAARGDTMTVAGNNYVLSSYSTTGIPGNAAFRTI